LFERGIRVKTLIINEIKDYEWIKFNTRQDSTCVNEVKRKLRKVKRTFETKKMDKFISRFSFFIFLSVF
jgi:hypothetical protein